MRRFGWLPKTGIPPTCDLRLCGWSLATPEDAACLLAHTADGDPADRPRTLLIGVGSPLERGRGLARGFGDVVGPDVVLAEVEARAARIIIRAGMLPRVRQIGRLTLDLLHRDGAVENRRLGLHPREFALLWRLADVPGEPVDKPQLLAEVWRLGYVPETNSLAVHVFRLRRKLEAVGLAGLVRTTPEGAYALALPAIAMVTRDSHLDAHIRLAQGAAQGARHEA